MTVSRLVMLKNAKRPMEVTDAGMVMEVIATALNENSPMVNSPLPVAKVTDARSKHSENAAFPISVTDAGMVMESSAVDWNALVPM